MTAVSPTWRLSVSGEACSTALFSSGDADRSKSRCPWSSSDRVVAVGVGLGFVAAVVLVQGGAVRGVPVSGVRWLSGSPSCSDQGGALFGAAGGGGSAASGVLLISSSSRSHEVEWGVGGRVACSRPGPWAWGQLLVEVGGGRDCMLETFLMPGRRARYKVAAAVSSMDVGWMFRHPEYEQLSKQIHFRQLLVGNPVVGMSFSVRKPAADATVVSFTLGNFRRRALSSRESANTFGPEGLLPAAWAPGLAGASLGV